MASLIDHILKLTDHRDRDLLELTLSKALIDVLPVQRIVIARVTTQGGERRWLEVARLDANGGGRFLDPLRIDFHTLTAYDDAPERVRCLNTRAVIEVAWAGEVGPRIHLLPLFSETRPDDLGVIEVHGAGPLTAAAMQVIDQLRRIYRNMYALLEHSDRDALTGLLNRQSLDDAFYSAVLEDMDGVAGVAGTCAAAPESLSQERRHRVPANYWLGSVQVDDMAALRLAHGHGVADQVIKLVGRVLSNTFRTYDRLYRFQGAHFGVLMHCPDEALVLSAFERARQNVEKYSFPHGSRVSVSAGFTPVLAQDNPDSSLEKAGHAVAFSQRSGGNMSCSHLGLVRRGYSLVGEPELPVS